MLSGDVKVVVLVPANEPVVVVVVKRVFVIKGDSVAVAVVELTGVWVLDVVVAELVVDAGDITLTRLVVLVVGVVTVTTTCCTCCPTGVAETWKPKV